MEDMTNHLLKEFLNGKTIARSLLNVSIGKVLDAENLAKEELEVLEIGSEPASHQKFLPSRWKIIGSNYKPMSFNQYVVDAEKQYPFPTNKFDGVICFNTLYCVDNYINFLGESLRVSKKFVYFQIPLIQAVLVHPNDYTRMTEDGIIKNIDFFKKNYNIKEFKILPIGGSFSSAVSLIDPYLKFRIIRIPVYYLAIILDRLDKKIGRRCPIMYLVLIKKDERI